LSVNDSVARWLRGIREGDAFATESICYVPSLLVDDGVSKVMANVLRRFLRPG